MVCALERAGWGVVSVMRLHWGSVNMSGYMYRSAPGQTRIDLLFESELISGFIYMTS